MEGSQRIFLARHGERVDDVDNRWISTAEVGAQPLGSKTDCAVYAACLRVHATWVRITATKGYMALILLLDSAVEAHSCDPCA